MLSRTIPVLRAVPAIAMLRIFTSYGWLASAFTGKDAKWAPSFIDGSALVDRIHTTFVLTAVPGVADVLTAVVVPHAAIFAVSIALGDTFAGLSLLFGFATRLGGVVSALRAFTNILVAAGAGADAVGFNEMLIVAGVICAVCAAGRKWGIDARLVAMSRDGDAIRLIA
jgi:uncharacterized membrane protein YphA (DoxX/SURF4 family)